MTIYFNIYRKGKDFILYVRIWFHYCPLCSTKDFKSCLEIIGNYCISTDSHKAIVYDKQGKNKVLKIKYDRDAFNYFYCNMFQPAPKYELLPLSLFEKLLYKSINLILILKQI